MKSYKEKGEVKGRKEEAQEEEGRGEGEREGGKGGRGRQESLSGLNSKPSLYPTPLERRGFNRIRCGHKSPGTSLLSPVK